MPSMDSEESGELPEEPRDDQKHNKQKIGAAQSTAEADSEDENEKGQPVEHSEQPVVLAASQVHTEPVNSNELHGVCLVAGPTASRWDADDEEEAEEKPVKSRWGDDDKEENATRDEDDIPENAAQEALVARDDPANVEEDNKTAEADDPGASNDAQDQNQETSNTRRSKRNMLFGCRSKDDFEHLRDIGQGTYGAVSKCGLPSVYDPGCLLQNNCISSKFSKRCTGVLNSIA
jgi:hypothetical protein